MNLNLVSWLEQGTNRDDLTSHGILLNWEDGYNWSLCILCTSIRTESLSVVNTVHKGACSYDGFTFKECSDYQTALVTVTGTIVTNWIRCIAKFWFSIHGSLQDCVYTSKKKKKQQLTSNMYKHNICCEPAINYHNVYTTGESCSLYSMWHVHMGHYQSAHTEPQVHVVDLWYQPSHKPYTPPWECCKMREKP